MLSVMLVGIIIIIIILLIIHHPSSIFDLDIAVAVLP